MSSTSFAFPHEKYFKAGILTTAVVLVAIGAPLLRKPLAKLKGKGLNARAWRATFYERHLPVPPGPRDGFWGDLMPKQILDPVLGWRDAETHIPGRVNIDADGLQYAANDPHPNNRLLFIGGSVGFGAYASDERHTYFSQCVYHLRQQHRKARVIVMAAGGWTSVNELAAFRMRGMALHPEVVVFLDGLNDLTLHREIPMPQRIANYLERMKQARDLALAHHMKIVFAPQPFLPDKPGKSALETIIVSESYRPVSELIDADRQIRSGLRALAIPGKVFVVDCSDVFNRSRHTIFTDIWHFTDIGQGTLGAYLARNIAPLLKPAR